MANKILKYYRRSTIVLYSLVAGTATTGGRSQTDLALVWADLVLPTVETFQGLLAGACKRTQLCFARLQPTRPHTGFV